MKRLAEPFRCYACKRRCWTITGFIRHIRKCKEKRAYPS